MEAHVDHKPLTVDSALAQWREWSQQLLADAREALTAARHDFDRARQALLNLRSNSQLLAYVESKFKAAPAKPARRARKAAR
jgi:hypothetical protein